MVENIPIPPIFLERMKRTLGEEYDDFEAALEKPPVSGLRINTLKLTVEEFRRISPLPVGETVPWAPGATLLKATELSPGLHPHHRAGLYYLQDPSAMSPASLLDPQPGERVLDLAAAPGGKTTQLAALMRGRGLLVANEIKDTRVGHLVMNVERWGAGNILITNETPERLADHFGAWFDRVLVDAPCSGEGMFRKDVGARADWSPEMVTGCAIRQRNILRVAAKLVKPGGYLLYSTCTFAPEENEEVVLTFLEEHPEFETCKLPDFPGFLGGQTGQTGGPDSSRTKRESLGGAVRLLPHRLQGEGHFACLLQRGEGRAPAIKEKSPGRKHSNEPVGMRPMQEALWNIFREEALQRGFDEGRLTSRGERLYFMPEEMPALGNLRVVHPGIWLGNFKKNRFEPAHPLALFIKAGDAKECLDFQPDDPQLAAYLRGEPIPSAGKPGWTLICVDGFGLGWGKRVQGVVKNHYPKGWI